MWLSAGSDREAVTMRIEQEARTAWMVTESEMAHVCGYRMLERLQSKLPGKVLLVSDGSQITWLYRYGGWRCELQSPLTTYANNEELDAHANFLVGAFDKQMRVDAGSSPVRKAVSALEEILDHWDINDSETQVAECSQCHNERPCQLRVDPFVAQRVYAEYEGQTVVCEWWCRPCFDYRAGDV